ncbi:MAG: hypothetical protein ACT4O6_03875 [Reyranella sp.]
MTKGRTRGLLRLLGYIWIVGLATLIMVIAGVDWLSDFRNGPHVDLSQWTYFELIACFVPGIVAIVLAGRIEKH